MNVKRSTRVDSVTDKRSCSTDNLFRLNTQLGSSPLSFLLEYVGVLGY